MLFNASAHPRRRPPFRLSPQVKSPTPATTRLEPTASASVKGSPRIAIASPIVTMGDNVEIIETACGDVRWIPALIMKVGNTVATTAQPSASHRKRGLAAKLPVPKTTWCSTQKTPAVVNAMLVNSAAPSGAMKRLARIWCQANEMAAPRTSAAPMAVLRPRSEDRPPAQWRGRCR